MDHTITCTVLLHQLLFKIKKNCLAAKVGLLSNKRENKSVISNKKTFIQLWLPKKDFLLNIDDFSSRIWQHTNFCCQKKTI